MPTLKFICLLLLVVSIATASSAFAQHEKHVVAKEIKSPSLPDGMSLDDVLDRAAQPKPDHFPNAIHDDPLRMFTLFEQLEYRIANDNGPDHLGWEAQGWVGFDFDKFWWKSEGEAGFEGTDEGESEHDFLYSRLISPFWSVQVGVRYANEWESTAYSDTWSGVIALQGLAPGMFEVDSSLYVSEYGNVSAEFEIEYNLRLTQRLVLQPRAELTLFAQDIEDDNIGAGLSDVKLDLRLRYEIKRGFAPYVGVRYKFLVGETANLSQAASEDAEQLFFLTGIRFAF